MYVLAHGAGAGMRHPFLEALSAALAREGVATLRYQVPYMEAGSRRSDPAQVLEARVRAAVAAARAHGLRPGPGGKAVGGPMAPPAPARRPPPRGRRHAFV